MNQDEKLADMYVRLKELIPVFNGIDSDVVGGVLGQLVAMYMAGHNPEGRAQVRAAFDRMVNDLIDAMDTSEESPWPKETRQ